MGVLGRLQIYVLTRTLAGLATATAVIASVVMLICFVELSRAYGGRADVGFVRLVQMMMLQSPAIVLLLLPFIFLFGTMAAFVTLNRRSELIAMRAAGVSAWRFVMPAAAAAALIGIFTMTALNPIASEMSATFDRLRAQLLDGPAGADKTIWLRQGDRHRQVIIRARSNQGPGVHLKGVSLFINKVMPDGRLQFAERYEASDAVLKHRTWTLSGVRAFGAGALGISSPKIELPSDLSEHTALERFSAANAIPFWSLPEMIVRTEAAGISSTAYRLQLQQLLATPLMYAAMSVLAAAFSLRLLRLGGMAQFAGSGVALGFVFFFFNQLCSSLGKSDVLPPSVAAWAPPVMALLVGITLLCYTEDG